MRLQDKVAIITGAANGIGLAAAEIFAREGAKVALTDYNVEQGKYKASELREKGYEVTFFQVDVANRQSVDQMVNQVVQTYENIDIIINNAGITRDGGKLLILLLFLAFMEMLVKPITQLLKRGLLE